jgi:hypothetical protein
MKQEGPTATSVNAAIESQKRRADLRRRASNPH